jgi:hypothetical protein
LEGEDCCREEKGFAGKLLEVELLEMLNLFAHSLAVDRQFGELFFRFLERCGEERRVVESGFLLSRLRRESFGAEEVFNWRR